MDTTTNLKLPYIMAAQAQKHVTHNEAIRALDAIVQIGVTDRDLATPPGTPSEGDRYIVGASATGDWAGKDNQIAAWQDGAWVFYIANVGWLAWVADEDVLVVWDGMIWVTAGGESLNPTPLVGVNATADTTNRLAVSSAASLFNHAGNGHQQTINKNAVGDTASQLYQTNFSGRAEIGLTGDDNFHFKVSSDGTAFVDAITLKDAAGVGFVGMGTDNPIRQLHVRNTTQAVVAKIEGPSTGTTLFRIHRNGESEGTGVEISHAGPAAAQLRHNSTTHISFDGAGKVTLTSGPVVLKLYTVAGLPSASASGAGAMVYVTDETGGAVPAFSDGTNWRRVTDRSVVS